NFESVISAVTFGTGRAGAVTVNTPRLTMFDGGLITSATAGDGPAGAVPPQGGRVKVGGGGFRPRSRGVGGETGRTFAVGKRVGGGKRCWWKGQGDRDWSSKHDWSGKRSFHRHFR